MPFGFCDTDSLNYLIWTQEIYGKSSNSLELLFSKNKASLYLLCCPDIPWVYDPLRQNPTDRDRLFKLYWQFLQSKHLPICFVSGIGIQRFKKACFLLKIIFQKSVTLNVDLGCRICYLPAEIIPTEPARVIPGRER